MSSTANHDADQSTPISASAVMRRRPSWSFEIGSWSATIVERVDQEDDADPVLRDARVVLDEDRQELRQRDDPDHHEEQVQRREAHERPVAEHVAVGTRRRVVGRPRGRGDRERITAKTRKVAASSRNSFVKLSGEPVRGDERRPSVRRGRSRGSSSRAAARRRRGAGRAASGP